MLLHVMLANAGSTICVIQVCVIQVIILFLPFMNVVGPLSTLIMLRTLGKNFSRRHFEIFFLFLFPKNMLWHIIMSYYQSGATYFFHRGSCLMNLGQFVCGTSCLWGELSCTHSVWALWPLELQVPGSIPGLGKGIFGIRTRVPSCHLLAWHENTVPSFRLGH